MKFVKTAAILAISLVVAGSAFLPAWSATPVPTSPQDMVLAQPIGGDHSPSADARNEFLTLNRRVARDIRQAYLTSILSAAAESEYIAGQHAFRNGNYQRAVEHLQQAEEQLKGFPNRPSLN